MEWKNKEKQKIIQSKNAKQTSIERKTQRNKNTKKQRDKGKHRQSFKDVDISKRKSKVK